jgi:hypothetical protein
VIPIGSGRRANQQIFQARILVVGSRNSCSTQRSILKCSNALLSLLFVLTALICGLLFSNCSADPRQNYDSMRFFFDPVTRESCEQLSSRSIVGNGAGAPPDRSRAWKRCQDRMIHESTRTQSKTLAREAERQRRRELETKWNHVERRTLPPTLERASSTWLAVEKPHLAKRTYEIYEVAVRCHLVPALRPRLLWDIGADAIASYQARRKGGDASSVGAGWCRPRPTRSSRGMFYCPKNDVLFGLCGYCPKYEVYFGQQG